VTNYQPVGGHLVGSLFRFISDDIAETVKTGECPSCAQTHPLFPIEATIDSDEWTYSSKCVGSLCALCIRRLPLRNFAWREGERIIQHIVNGHYAKGTLNGAERVSKLVSLCDEYRRTPTFPLFPQDEDWPFCCGSFCEYLGVPGTYDESIRIGHEVECWEGNFQELYGDMTLQPESLNEVCLFRCLACEKRVFTWQCT